MTVHFIDTEIQGLRVLKPKLINDERGFFAKIFCSQTFGIKKEEIKQINQSFTLKTGTVRGMHFQHPPFAEVKIVTCIQGEVFDVALDLRKESASFMQWHSEILSEENHNIIIIPKGLAHGFQTLTDNCTLLYFHTEIYNSNFEGGINILDPLINIKWPLEIGEQSLRDREFPYLERKFSGLNI